MKKAYIRITELEAVLTDHTTDHEGFEIADMTEELFQLNHMTELYEQLNKVPVNPDTGQTEQEFYGFPAGTDKEDILQWFEEQFGVIIDSSDTI